jgi:chromosome partitioning protein
VFTGYESLAEYRSRVQYRATHFCGTSHIRSRKHEAAFDVQIMAKIICIANQKGGVGKTTTAINLAAGLAAAEKKTLLIDMDPQGNAGSGLGIDKAQVEQSVYHVLIGEKRLADVVRRTELEFLDIAPANADLTGAEIELVSAVARETRLRKAIAEISGRYDFILIDCPPSLGLLTLNALTAADTVLVPLQCEYYAMEGLSQLLNTIELVRQALNPTLAREGILLTMFDPRNKLCHQVADDVRAHFNEEVFAVVIPRNVRLSESPSFGKPVILYDVTSKGATAYLALADEIIKKNPGARRTDSGNTEKEEGRASGVR